MAPVNQASWSEGQPFVYNVNEVKALLSMYYRTNIPSYRMQQRFNDKRQNTEGGFRTAKPPGKSAPPYIMCLSKSPSGRLTSMTVLIVM